MAAKRSQAESPSEKKPRAPKKSPTLQGEHPRKADNEAHAPNGGALASSEATPSKTDGLPTISPQRLRFWERHYSSLRGYCRHLVGSHPYDAMALVHDVYCKFMSDPKFDVEHVKAKSRLNKIAENTWVDILRKKLDKDV